MSAVSEPPALLWNAVIAQQVTLGLVPEVLDPVDVIDAIGEQIRMVDPDVMELGNIQNIIGAEIVGVDDAVRPHLIPDDWEKRVCTGIGDDNNITFPPRFNRPKTGTLPVAQRLRLPFLRPPK